MTEFKKVTGCKPCGSQVLIELLTSQEILQTKLYVINKKLASEYQAVVLAVGPSLKENISNYGFNVGDRVVISGNATPVPDYDNSDREKVLVEPFAIKAVLT